MTELEAFKEGYFCGMFTVLGIMFILVGFTLLFKEIK